MQKKAEQKNYLRQNPHLKQSSPEKPKKKKKLRKKKTDGSHTSGGFFTRGLTPKTSSSRMPQLSQQLSERSVEGSSFVFKRPDLLKDALAAPAQNFLRRMSHSHKIRDFNEKGGEEKTTPDEVVRREYSTMQEFICFYSSSESESDKEELTRGLSLLRREPPPAHCRREEREAYLRENMRMMRHYNQQRIRAEQVQKEKEDVSMDTSNEGKIGAATETRKTQTDVTGKLRVKLQLEMREGFGIDIEKLINSMRDLKRDSNTRATALHPGKGQWGEDEAEQSFDSEGEFDVSSNESSIHDSDVLKDLKGEDESSQGAVESEDEKEDLKLEKILQKSEEMAKEAALMRLIEVVQPAYADTLRVNVMKLKGDETRTIKNSIVQKFLLKSEGSEKIHDSEVVKVRKNYMAYKHQLLFFQKYFLRWKKSGFLSLTPRVEGHDAARERDDAARRDGPAHAQEGAQAGGRRRRRGEPAPRGRRKVHHQHALPHRQA